MHTIFRSLLSQYSRRLLSILAHPQQHKEISNHMWCIVFFDHRMKYTATDEHQLTCTVVQNIKKNAEHTHMYTILRTLSSQYSRRLLSILARPNQQKKIKLTKRYECLLYRL